MRFGDLLGQDKPLSLIQDSIAKNRLSGGYIFSGPEGIGKKRAAKILAQALNCTAEAERPCGSCSSCLKTEKLQHPDLYIIEHEEAQIKIEDIREMQRQASLRPYEGEKKVFLIDNAHRLNPESANSLLKILEEPPASSLFILITHKPQAIFKTVLSRCKTIKFAPLARVRLENILIKNYAIDKSSAHFLAFYSEGRLGLALRLKDSLSLGEKNRIFDSFLFKEKPSDQHFAGQNKDQLRVFLNMLASWFRDIYILKAGANPDEIIHLDRRDDLSQAAERYSFSQLDDILGAISESLLYLDRNINAKLLLHNLGAQLWKV